VNITSCNGKGGSGKTTLAILLAAALTEAGHEVAVLDTDPQKPRHAGLRKQAA